VAPGCVPDKLRIIDDAVRSGEPEHPPLLVPVKRQGLGASEARSGACGLPAFQNSRDDPVLDRRALPAAQSSVA
jgi:hypothetical protein